MKKIKLGLLVIFSVLLVTSNLFASGGKRSGTAGATELLIPIGARGIAMAGATITGSSGVEAIYWNPANLARGTGSANILVSNMNYLADITVQYGAISANVGGLGTVAFHLKSLNIGEIPITTNEFPDGTGGVMKPGINVIGFTYSILLSDRISVGATANYISENMDRVKASGVSFDLGISYNNLANIKGLNFAVVIKNLGSPMKYEGTGLNVLANAEQFTRDASRSMIYKIDAAEFELPSTIEMGLGYKYNFNEDHSLQVNSVYKNDNYYNDEVKLGGEYSFKSMLFLRAGYLITPEKDTKYENLFNGLHAGFGIKYDLSGTTFSLDYAYRQMLYFDANHVISLGINF